MVFERKDIIYISIFGIEKQIFTSIFGIGKWITASIFGIEKQFLLQFSVSNNMVRYTFRNLIK